MTELSLHVTPPSQRADVPAVSTSLTNVLVFTVAPEHVVAAPPSVYTVRSRCVPAASVVGAYVVTVMRLSAASASTDRSSSSAAGLHRKSVGWTLSEAWTSDTRYDTSSWAPLLS